jgi:hypothetical protein
MTAAASLHANDYSPFLPSERFLCPRLLESHWTWVGVHSGNQTCTVDLGQQKDSILTLNQNKRAEEKALLRIQGVNGKVQAWTIREPGAYMDKIYVGCLNADSIPDIVIDLGETGNGLAPREIVVLLSNGSGYDAYDVFCANFEPSNFIRYSPQVGICLLQTFFVYGEIGLDGRMHNYWANRLLRVDDSSFSEVSSFGHHLIRFTDRSNHEETDQLTADQKQRLWGENVADYSVVRLHEN